MLRFLGDMFIGWIVFTDSGKQAVNKVMNKTFNHVKNSVLKSTQLQEIMSLKDIFEMNNSNEEKSNNNDLEKEEKSSLDN